MAVNPQELRERVASFSRWHYRFELGEVTTPIFDPDHVNRHEQRQAYIFDALLPLYGGSLAGKRVLDLGCNAGYWSLQAVNAGCEHVVGIDGRGVHIEQAHVVFDALEVPRRRYDFVVGNVLDVDLREHGPFDIVLCLGLLYHVSKPVELFERISAVNTDLLVVDTALTMARGSWFKVGRDELTELPSAVDYELVFFPTREAILDLASQFGYASVVVRPTITNPIGMRDYLLGCRRAFFCAKKADLGGVTADSRRTPGRWRRGTARGRAAAALFRARGRSGTPPFHLA